MSYVRFSCDGHRSDVYAYEHCDGGYTLHVAARARVGLDDIPPCPELNAETDAAAWSARHKAHSEALRLLPWRTIEHSDAGKRFHFGTLRELRDALAAYRDGGVIHVPDGVVEAIDEEMEAGRCG